MTFGTQTIPYVYKIFGAGNSYVTAAKMLALETISIDMPAGPSEVFVIADETAKPAYIAADLLADGEHGEDSACVLITTSQGVAEQTIKEIEKQSQVKDEIDTENVHDDLNATIYRDKLTSQVIYESSDVKAKNSSSIIFIISLIIIVLFLILRKGL
jgi:histidinol dehydrogenase